MGLYVEVQCDRRKGGIDPLDKHNLRARCWSNRNESAQGVNVRHAKAEARAQGWKLGRGNAACCPGCK